MKTFNLQKADEQKFYEEIKLCFLEVIKIGLKFSKNEEIKKLTKNIMDEYRIFGKKFGETSTYEDEITTEDIDKDFF